MSTLFIANNSLNRSVQEWFVNIILNEHDSCQHHLKVTTRFSDFKKVKSTHTKKLRNHTHIDHRWLHLLVCIQSNRLHKTKAERAVSLRRMQANIAI